MAEQPDSKAESKKHPKKHTPIFFFIVIVLLLSDFLQHRLCTAALSWAAAGGKNAGIIPEYHLIIKQAQMLTGVMIGRAICHFYNSFAIIKMAKQAVQVYLQQADWPF